MGYFSTMSTNTDYHTMHIGWGSMEINQIIFNFQIPLPHRAVSDVKVPLKTLMECI